MATFPTMDRVVLDDRQPDTGLNTVVAPDGGLFGQSLYDEEFWIFNPVFISVTQTEMQTLQTFYATNKLVAFDFAYTHKDMTTITYECNFVSPGIKVMPQLTGTFICQAYFRGRIKP